ncbi:MAG: hypothetical protein WCW84_06110 [Sulfurimonas sp.]
MNKILILILLILFSGCATKNKAFFNINAGDSKASVIDKLGYPEDRQFNGKHEAIQYCTTGTSFGVSTFDVVWLYDGKVTGVNSYNLHGAGMCSGHFESVKWEDAPNQTIEVRQR